MQETQRTYPDRPYGEAEGLANGAREPPSRELEERAAHGRAGAHCQSHGRGRKEGESQRNVPLSRRWRCPAKRCSTTSTAIVIARSEKLSASKLSRIRTTAAETGNRRWRSLRETARWRDSY